MRYTHLFAALMVGLVLAAGSARAQQQPLRGVVWQEPQDLQQAVAELYAMRRAGIEGVRTGLVRDERLLGVADALGMQFFQEIPVENRAAGELRDSVQFAARMLDQALARSRGHQSARHFGLARLSDTSDPAACAYFGQLARRARQIIPGAKVYYVTPFVEQDACADAVDFVLLQSLDAPDPMAPLLRWHRDDSTATPAGLAALGTWVREDGPRGLRVPHSLEAQGRYLEESLTDLFTAPDSLRPYAVFVYRWRDARADDPGSIRGDEALGRAYGIRSATGPRPAFEVVSGIYSGRQTVFAFEPGEAPNEAASPWRTLIGWGSVALLGVLFATSPRLRIMMPRYFSARGFYRDAIREGRDVLLGSSATLLVVLALTTGLIWSAFGAQLARADYYLPVLSRLSALPRTFLVWLDEGSWAGVLLMALLYVLSLGVWSLLLALASRRRYVLSPTQTLMLAVWPRWPILLLLPAALVAPGLVHGTGFQVALWVVGLWLAISVVTVIRTVYDFTEVTRVPFYVAIGVLLVNPLVLVLLAMGLVMVVDPSGTAFLYHLFTRT